MNGLLRKEIKLLAPTWGVALVLIIAAWLVAGNTAGDDSWRAVSSAVLLFGLCPLVVMFMALHSVGRELDAGTFGQLLAQPVSRHRVWWTKTLLLAAALLSVWALWWFSFSEHPGFPVMPDERREVFLLASLVPLVAYAGGLWTVLLFRQVAAAFWFTFIIPAALASFTGYACEKLGLAQHTVAILVAVLVTYAAAGFAFAMRLFLRAQDVQWTGGEITLPGWLRWPRWLSTPRVATGRHPRLALLRKELQLHQSQFVIAGVLAVVHLAVVLVRQPEADLRENPVWQFAAYQTWVLWPVMALLVGCSAVAEERKLGTLEPQLCLPVRRRTQFFIKAGIALALSLLFGVIAPVVLEGGRILPEFKPDFDAAQLIHRGGLTWGGFYQLAVLVVAAVVPFAPFVPFVLVATVLLGISFYASTLSRNTLQAIAPAMVGVLALWVAVFGLESLAGLPNAPWRGPLIYVLGIPVVMLTIAGLAYWNFKRVLVGWPVWRRNLLTWLATLLGVAAVTTFVYHRTWEHFQSLEPAPGPARFSLTQRPETIADNGGSFTVRLPEGRLWQTRWVYDTLPDLGGRPRMFNPQSLPGSNWISSAGPIARTETVAIQADGSLWVIETPTMSITWSNNRPLKPIPAPSTLQRVGTDRDWQQIIRQAWSPACLLLKRDGSLWQLGTNQFGFSKRATEKWPGLRAFAPRRLGTDSDWARMLWVGNSIYFWKQDGKAWVQNPMFRGPKQPLVELGPGLAIERYPEFDQLHWRRLSTGQPYQIGVREDGTLWGYNLPVRALADPNVRSGRMSHDTNWLTVAASSETAVALRADGTLWKWNLAFRRHHDRRAAIPTRLSANRDWVAITGDWDGIIALAADGSLWHWRFEAWPTRIGKLEIPPLLAASRRPARLGNIFAATP